MDSPAVLAKGLVKNYDDTAAVGGIDFMIARGEFVGILGPNGAGKSTTMRMVGCVSDRTDGHLEVLGRDPSKEGAALRARLGVCPQEDFLDVELTARQNLTTYARYFGISRRRARARTDELLEFMGLADRGDARVDSLSGGMRRRLTIGRALMNEPELMLLDEPTTGLDPQARHLVWDRLRDLRKLGTTVVLTTHFMDEAEQLSDRLIVIDGGRIIAEGTPRELIETHLSGEVVEFTLAAEEAELWTPVLKDLATRVEVLSERVLLYTDNGDSVVEAMGERGLRPPSLLIRRTSLEDVFLRLTGRALAGA